ncbi:MAG: AAA family ATPase [Hyphomicrobiales bacterium]
MKINKIHIKNFRSIQDLSFEFSDNLNVFVGANGAGKTTVLEAISISLSWMMNRIRNMNSNGASITDLDIRYNTDYSMIEGLYEADKQEYKWKHIKVAEGKSIKEKSSYTGATELAEVFQSKLNDNKELPVIAYYPVTRTVEDADASIKGNEKLSRLDLYDDALKGKSNYQSFFKWYRLQDDINNEQLLAERNWFEENKQVRNKFLANLNLKINEYLKKKGIALGRYDKLLHHYSDYMFNAMTLRSFLDQLSLLYHSISIELGANRIHFIEDAIMSYYALKNVGNKIVSYMKSEDDINLFINEITSVILFKDDLSKLNELDKDSCCIILDFYYLIIDNALPWISKDGKEKLYNYLKDLLSLKESNQQRQFTIRFIELVKNELVSRERSLQSSNSEVNTFIKKTIESFLPNYKNLQVKRIPYPHLSIDKGENSFNVGQLSDGEKNLITLIADIARRLIIANTYSENPLKGNGIILIDEVELHLHPKWQRKVIPQLLKTFPNCQFFITTHSPQVVSHVQPDSLFLLSNNDNVLSVSEMDESYGMNTDRVLEDIFATDARPKEIKGRFKELYRLIDAGEYDKARSEHESLSRIISGDDELSYINVLIDRKRLLGK